MVHLPTLTADNLKRGGLGVTAGLLIGEFAVPVVYKVAKYLPRRIRRVVHRYSPSHNKGIGVSVMTYGLFSGNPILLGAGTGLIAADAYNYANKDKRMLREANLAINGHPPISIEKYDIPDWLPNPMKYKIIGEKFRELVMEDTYNKARAAWIPAGRDHPAVLVTARKIIKQYGLDGHDKVGVLQAIQHWIQTNINYCYDTRFLDQFVHPYLTLMFGAGDCDDQTLLACSLGEALGIEMKARLISQYPKDPTHMNHVYSVGVINGEEYPIETIFKGVPFTWQAPSVNHTDVPFM